MVLAKKAEEGYSGIKRRR